MLFLINLTIELTECQIYSIQRCSRHHSNDLDSRLHDYNLIMCKKIIIQNQISNYPAQFLIQFSISLKLRLNMNLKELKQLLDQVNIKQSPYWESIFKSDMRNIFPKYEVCKIQSMKNQVSKIRLIMENINHFTQMESQRSSLKSSVASISQNISEQVNQLLKQNKSKNVHYNSEVSSKKDLIQKLVRQFSKPIHLSLLKNVKNNQKWNQYIQSHMQQPLQINYQDLDQERINIAQTFPILGTNTQNAQNQLLQNQMDNWNFQFLQKCGSGYEGKVFEKRVKQKMMVDRLVNYLYKQNGQNSNSEVKDEQKSAIEQQFQELKRLYQI